jgi:hypothetical protein
MLGDFFGGLAGGRAGGGDVNYGQSYLVGKNVPEIFTPPTSGLILPNSALDMGNSGPTINVDARGADAGAEYRARAGALAAMRQASINGYLLNREMGKRGA